MEAFLSTHQLDPEVPSFNASNGFVHDFKTRKGFRSRRAYMKPRPRVEAEAEVL
jgi:hypothetical protein